MEKTRAFLLVVNGMFEFSKNRVSVGRIFSPSGLALRSERKRCGEVASRSFAQQGMNVCTDGGQRRGGGR
jgi:hypothetical protein